MAFSESRVKMIFMMNWKDIWMTLFGTVDLLGLNEGFWVSMAVVALIVVVMNAVFGGMKPRKKATSEVKRPCRSNTVVGIYPLQRKAD